MNRDVYIETSVISYLTSKASRNVRAAAWQQITKQWWKEEKKNYNLYISELVLTEALLGDTAAAKKRAKILNEIPILMVNEHVKILTQKLIKEKGVPEKAQADALHIAIACVHSMDYLLTWNCRHIDNAIAKPLIRKICKMAGYTCPEICTPFELLTEE